MMLFRSASFMSSTAYGFSLMHGTKLAGLGRGAPFGFKGIMGGTGGLLSFGIGGMIGARVARANEAGPGGKFLATIAGGAAGIRTFDRAAEKIGEIYDPNAKK